MKKIFITTITFNNPTAILDCLDSLEEVRKDNFDLSLVIVDNGSKEKFKLNKKYKNFETTLLRSEENLGFSGGQNLGIKHALKNAADYVIVLNDDVVVDKNLIINLLNSYKEGVGIVSPKIYFAKGYEFHKDRYDKDELGKVLWYAGGKVDWDNVFGQHIGVDEVDKGQFDGDTNTEIATGCCMMISKEVFDKVGVFDDDYFLYYEDADLNMRARKKGFKILFAPTALLWHKNASSTEGSGSTLQDYYITRNRMIFGFKYASQRVKFALFRESLRILSTGRQFQKKGIIDFYLKRLGKGTYFK